MWEPNFADSDEDEVAATVESPHDPSQMDDQERRWMLLVAAEQTESGRIARQRQLQGASQEDA
jgi:hypothetical protein